MSLDGRLIRKESRIRGSGTRNVQVNEFNIASKRKKKLPRGVDNLKSALINPDSIENLPRLRTRSTRTVTNSNGNEPINERSSTTTSKLNLQASEKHKVPVSRITSLEDTNENTTPAHQIQQSVYDEIDLFNNNNNNISENEYGDNLNYDINDSIYEEQSQPDQVSIQSSTKRRPGRPKKVIKPRDANKRPKGRPRKVVSPVTFPDEIPTRKPIPRHSKPTKLNEIPSDDDLEASLENDTIEYNSNSNPTTLVNRTLKGRSRLKDILSGGSNVEPANIQEKIAKISKNVNERQRSLDKSKSQSNSGSRRVLRSRVTPIPTTPQAAPIPLSKTRIKEKQKPLTIDIERLKDDNNRDKRFKINTLDVLSHLIKQFEPQEQKSKLIKEHILQEEFKAHVLSQVQYLQDIYSTIGDLGSRISQVQKLKNQYRKRIFDLRNDHANVGNELNIIRQNYQQDKKKIEDLGFINEQLQTIIQSAQSTQSEEENNNSNNNNIDNLVQNELVDLNRIINPQGGIFNKLKVINEKLTLINTALEE
ncbi:uncharacterized protein RJT21DRAFT_124738 [Scheffersomyces amazonensis]|uniref:uncharacterized protein n=1 Tax=Scheffersomyces amazonensis TaxID=1078765 RepID=UPI00315D67B1